MNALAALLRSRGEAGGLAGFGICSADPFPDVADSIRDRVAAGHAGRLKFTFADPDLATDVRRTFPWAERLVVGAWAYLPAAGSPGDADGATGRVARFSADDYYAPLSACLNELAVTIRDAGFRAEILVDDNRLVDRAAAVRSGVGWWGKNTMVLAPKFGPWLLLGSVVTNAALPVSEAMSRDCGTCSACLPACPTGALVAPGVLDASRCLSHWAQVPGIIPTEFRKPMADRVYGCDDCLDACPPGGRLLERSASHQYGRVDLSWMLTASDEDLLERFARFYIPRRDPDYLRRNALVAIGNSRLGAHLRVVEPYLESKNWILRAHSLWAWGELGGDLVVAVERARREERPEVLEELRALGVSL